MSIQPNNQEDIDKYIEQLIAKSDKEIEKLFSHRLKVIQSHIADMFERYQTDDVHVTWAEFNKYNRLNKELDRIAEMMTDDYKKVARLIKDTQENSYINKYLMALYLYEQSKGVEINFTVPDKQTIQSAIEQPIEFIRLMPTLQKHRNEILEKIRYHITQGILNGDSYASIAKHIRESTEMSSAQAKRVARTETGRAQSIAGYDSAKEAESNGIKMSKVWLATKDARTRGTHRHLDGTTIGIDEMFKSSGCKGLAPHLFVGASSGRENINCRCDLMFLVDGEKPDMMRVKEDGAKESKVVPYQPYNEWIKNKG